jgi:hypothetical protein
MAIGKHKACYEPFVEDDRRLDAHPRAMRDNATWRWQTRPEACSSQIYTSRMKSHPRLVKCLSNVRVFAEIGEELQGRQNILVSIRP